VTFAGAVSLSGNQTTTGNLTVNGNTTLGDASTDTILMTGAPSIGGAGLGMGMGFRNRIINGAMVIDQRKAGASITPSNTEYTLDRWQAGLAQSAKFSVQQNSGSVTPPAGYTNYLGVVSLSAYSVGASDYFMIQQRIEGYNVADLALGTASAATIALSFWVRSSLTGTFGGAVSNGAENRSYPFSYTISVANTWEQKSVTIAGDTSGTWLTTNGNGLWLKLGLGVGSTYSGTAGAWAGSTLLSTTGATSVVGTNGATWYVTGVQIEKGSTATSFDYRPYPTELALCLRYFETNFPSGVAVGSISLPGFVSTNSSTNSSNEASGIQFSVKKRATPTIVVYHITTGTAGSVYRVSDAASVAVTPTHIGQSGIGFLALASSSANGYYWNYTASAEL
jgi:hypothetical protein